MDLTDYEKRQQRMKMIRTSENASVKFTYRLVSKREREKSKGRVPRVLSRVEAQTEAHRRWAKLGEFSTYPYSIAPGTLIVGGEFENDNAADQHAELQKEARPVQGVDGGPG